MIFFFWHLTDKVNTEIFCRIPVLEDSSDDDSPGDSSEGSDLTLEESSTVPSHTVGIDGTCETDENNAICFQESPFPRVEEHNLSEPSDREDNVLGIYESDSQDENETSQLPDEAYADEEWESDSSDGSEDEDSQDVPATENEPGSVNQIDSNSDDGEQPLYVGAPITLGTSTLLILTFAMTHSLSGEALSHLLELIDAHCITPNLCTKSITKLKSFFRQLKTPLCCHYYCPFCHGLLEAGVNTQECPYCGLSLSQDNLKKSFFIEMPIEQQLVDQFSSKIK